MEEEISKQESDAVKKTTVKKARFIILSIVFGVLFTLAVTVFALALWYKNNYFLEFKELLYILSSPLQGTGNSMIKEILMATVPFTAIALVFYVAVLLILKWRKWLKKAVKISLSSFCALALVGSLIFAVFAFRLNTYYKSMREITTLYEEQYIDPINVKISGENTRNLIYIYLENVESTHMMSKDGGSISDGSEYMPHLTDMAKENLCFSHNTDGLPGGFSPVFGSGWTVAALLASTSGIPFAFSTRSDAKQYTSSFCPGLTNLGDILQEKGYRQMFLCGSRVEFGGRDALFKQHGGYELYDLHDLRKDGYVSPLYHNGWWGAEDKFVYEMAKDKLKELSAGDQPFNLTMLTVDTHPQEGYICGLCNKNEFPTVAGNVLKCADNQVYEFIEWCKTQDFYENTTIIITGDHTRMDNALSEHVVQSDRKVYNCFINAVPTPTKGASERTWTTLDLFPTTLAAMGFEIEGDRLGLGVNMFSDIPTLAEAMGLGALNNELTKFSEFYLRKFS